MAGRRERRRPAEATPLCETRRWTRLLRKFTGGAWERQAPPRGVPSGATPSRWTRGTWAIHPAALSRLLRGVASRDQPQGNPRCHSGPRRWTRLGPRGWSRLTPVCRDSAANQPESRRWGAASLRLGLGAEPLVVRSPVSPAGAGGAGLVPVESGDSREPHRPPIRWGGSAGLPRCWGIESAPGTGRGRRSRRGCPPPGYAHNMHGKATFFLTLFTFIFIEYLPFFAAPTRRGDDAAKQRRPQKSMKRG